MCSDPGQDLIRQDIRDHQLNRIVVASCSPHLHEHTFRTALRSGGLNPYLLPHGQHPGARLPGCTRSKLQATRKAKDLVRAAVRRVALHRPWNAAACRSTPTSWWWAAASPESTPR